MGAGDPTLQGQITRVDAPEDPEILLAGLKRAIPASRMQDYGMAGNDVAVLSDLAPGGESWDAAAERLGQAHISRAAAFEAGGSLALAGQEREWAAAAFNVGQLSINTDSARKAALYARASAELQHVASRPGGDFMRLALGADPREKLYGWALSVENPIGAVVVIGGLSGWGASFLPLARTLTRRRIAVILAEGPGQGETRLVSKLHLSREGLRFFTPFIDRARRFSASVALVGNSFGGLIAAHIAAARADILACCVNSSPVRLRTPQFPAEREQIGAAFGADGEALARKIADFNFDPAVEHILCPMLILEGGADKLVPPGVQMDFLGGDAPADRTLLQLWPDGLHTIYNHATERNALISAWLTDRFLTWRRSGR